MKARGRQGTGSVRFEILRRQRSSVAAALLLLVAIGFWLSGSALSVPVAVGQSAPTRTPTAARSTRTPRTTRTSTPTRTATVSATDTPTAKSSATPTWIPTETLTAIPTETPTAIPPDTPTAIPTNAPTETQTFAATETATSVDTETPTIAPSVTPTLIETETATVIATDTPTISPTETLTSTVTETPTVTTTPTPIMTPSPVLTGTLTLSASPLDSYLAPGGVTSFNVKIINTRAITTTVQFTTTDSDPTFFTSSLQDESLSLAPGETGTTTLTVSVSSEAIGEIGDDTTIQATVDGIEAAGATVTSHLLYVQFNRAITGSGTSDHFVSPETLVQMQVGISSAATLTSTVLSDLVPGGWSVSDSGGGKLTGANGDMQKIEWNLKSVSAGAIVTRTYTLLSPVGTIPPPEYSFQTTLNGGEHKFFGKPWSVMLQHPLTLNHNRIGWDAPLDRMVYIANVDSPGTGIPRFRAFRVRFQVFNDQLEPVRWQPRLEWSGQSDGGFQSIFAGEPKAGDPFYIRPVDDGANSDRILTHDFGAGWDSHAPQEGYLFTNQNPASVVVLDSFSFTEIEFSVRATADAEYQQPYFFRLSDDGRLIPGQLAQIEMESEPKLHLTQPQYRGIAPNPLTSAKLKVKTKSDTSSSNPHGPYTLTDTECATCHRSHNGESENLLPNPSIDSNLCFNCHDGSTASPDILSQYTDPDVPANNPSTGTIYSHPALIPSTHSAGSNDEFHNVLNRQSDCVDCHNSHSESSTLASETANGYAASGSLTNISGVGIVGDSRTLTWKDSITYEYELCYKCHSSYTVLPTAPPETDQSAEFNPANPSFHPVERVGRNSSAAMVSSLTGTSPYKLWNFGTGDTIRCLNCHGDYRLANPASPPPANALLAPHTSVNPGLLMNNFRDRLLKSSGENYAASDFALCYQCHSEAPFADTTADPRDDTNFRFHGFHLNDIADIGSGGTDITNPGDGQGNALCSECHFQSHGQEANARGNESGAGLVNFAPDVQPNSVGSLKWDPSVQTCDLTCHGADHIAASYH